jgi:hypothetical protein
MISILFLAAEPTDMARLRLGEEVREIQEKLQLAKARDNFILHQRFSVRPSDISQALLDLNPQIVHFSGHGTATGEICIEDQLGKMHSVHSEALAALFEQFSGQVNCVVLNACYSETQARAIAKHIAYVIGIGKAIGDRAAIAFSVGFYQALGAGRSIGDAYKFGCVQIQLQGIPEHLAPLLISTTTTSELQPFKLTTVEQKSIRLHIPIRTTGQRYTIDTATDVSVGKLRMCLIHELELPLRFENKWPVEYSLVLEMQDGTLMHLDDNETLHEAGVQDGDTLIFVPRGMMGGGG